jgi:Protein of unknown function VcgC/VcgE (DUF2780)
MARDALRLRPATPGRARVRWCPSSRRVTFIGEITMPDTVNALSSETGLSADLIHKGLGAVLDFLRQHLGDEVYNRVQSAIPNAPDFLRSFEASPDGAGSGGLLGALTGLASKVLGGSAGDLAKLFESFSKLGLSAQQIESFLPKALEFLKAHLPADLIEQILSKIPALAKVAGGMDEA